MAGYGVPLRQDMNNEMDMTETSSLVAARNFARERAEQRRLEIISGGMSGEMRQRSVLQGGS